MQRTSAISVDTVVLGAGLAGLTAALELADSGLKVAILDQEGPQSCGGQAYWSFGGLFMVDTPEQRRLGIKDSPELAWQDWQKTAGFDREEDALAKQWAQAYVQWASGPKREWLSSKGHRIFPVVGWAERGRGTANGPGNSVPRFHITWGTGPRIVEIFKERLEEHQKAGRIQWLYRHKAERLLTQGHTVIGIAGSRLAEDPAPRGKASTREKVGEFEILTDAVVVATGGIGGNHDAVRSAWPERLGPPPRKMIAGVPEYVDGSGLEMSREAGSRIINEDRMWHYLEGVKNWDPVWKNHGIRILPGPSSLWLDGSGKRLPAPHFPGFDTLGTLEHLRRSGYDHSWFILNRRIIGKEFALSGQEQNPDLTGRSIPALLNRVRQDVPGPVQAFLDHGEDFVQAQTPEELIRAMNQLTPDTPVNTQTVMEALSTHEAQFANAFSKDLQTAAINHARKYRGDRLIRTVPPHPLTDPKAGPLIAVRLNILTRKSLGGVHTDLGSRALDPQGNPIEGLYAIGEVAGFGGGGIHGYRSLEGTFLGGCLFSARAAARDIVSRA